MGWLRGHGLQNLDLLAYQMVVSGSQKTWIPVPARPVVFPFLGLSLLIRVMGPCEPRHRTTVLEGTIDASDHNGKQVLK